MKLGERKLGERRLGVPRNLCQGAKAFIDNPYPLSITTLEYVIT